MPQGKKPTASQQDPETQGHENPPAGSMRPAMPAEYEEEATVSNPQEPNDGPQHAEEAAVIESQASLSGIDSSLLERGA